MPDDGEVEVTVVVYGEQCVRLGHIERLFWRCFSLGPCIETSIRLPHPAIPAGFNEKRLVDVMREAALTNPEMVCEYVCVVLCPPAELSRVHGVYVCCCHVLFADDVDPV